MNALTKFKMKDFGANRNGLPATYIDKNRKQRIIKSYDNWKSMFTRCYSPKYHDIEPTYIGCSVCDEWKNYANFKVWHDKNYVDGFALDKDLLLDGNKIYSPEFCRYVPRSINQLLASDSLCKGNLQKGVSFISGKFAAHISILGVNSSIGRFDTEHDAFEAYKAEKERYVKDTAQAHLKNGLIDNDIYNALVSWICKKKKVSI